MQKFKPIYIPIALTIILLIMAMGTGLYALKELVQSNMASYTSARSFLIILLLLILPLTLLLMMIAGFAYLGIAVGIWVFYGMCVLVVKLLKRYIIKTDSDGAHISEGTDSDFSTEINDGKNDKNAG